MTPLVLLHGFLGTPDDFDPLVASLGRKCVGANLPGHPSRDKIVWAFVYPSSFVGAVKNTLVWIEKYLALVHEGPVDVLGYSMGGRVALQMLCVQPDRFRRAVVVGASPGIEDAKARRRRSFRDEKVADRLERWTPDRFVDWWYAQPIFASLVKHPDFERIKERRRDACERKGAVMAQALRVLGVGHQEPLRKPLAACPVPALLVAGADDAKYVASNRALADANPKFEAVTVPGAGHAPHLEQPDEFARIVRDWLDRP